MADLAEIGGDKHAPAIQVSSETPETVLLQQAFTGTYGFILVSKAQAMSLAHTLKAFANDEREWGK